MKLTKAQERALLKLTHEWRCVYDIGESIPTLEGLVARGKAVMRRDALGVVFSPRTAISFKLTPNVEVQGLDASAACRQSPGTPC